MPGFDGTGPGGMGPMTGGGRGFCASLGYGARPGYVMGLGWRIRGGRGRGFGRGIGRGFAYWQAVQSGQVPYPYYMAPSTFGTELSPEQEIDLLKQQVEQISNRISELQKQDTE
ncbi:DUF5320 family protein [Candidatus Poribacteria bacterium]